MKLYFFPGACSLADHIVLEWVGAPYQAVAMTTKSIKSPEYLALNPHGTVPLLVDGELRLTQNAAILSYLAARYPEARLFGGTSPRERAEVLDWLSFLNSDVHPAFKPIFVPFRFHPDKSQSSVIANLARDRVRAYLDLLDTRLQGRQWLTQERSIADPYLFVMLRWAVRLDIGLEERANLQRFLDRMYVDPGVRAALVSEEGTAEPAQASLSA